MNKIYDQNTLIELQIGKTDGLMFIGVGIAYASILAGLMYKLLGYSFCVGLSHGSLLGILIGAGAFITVYLNNRYLLPKLSSVFLWWLISGLLSFLVGVVGFFFTYQILIHMNTNIPLIVIKGDNLYITLISVGGLTYLTGLLIFQFVRMRNRRELILIQALEADHMLTLRIMNIHFLANSLHTLLELIETDSQNTNMYLKNLIHVVRTALNKPTEVSLEEELKLIKSYVFVEKVRKGREILLLEDVEKSAYKYRIPSLILLPIVENAIVHGIPEKRETPLQIIIKAKVTDRNIVFWITNNGKLITALTFGTGLTLLAKRLKNIMEN